MELVRKKDNRTGFIISVALHIGLLAVIFIARGCIEIQNPPQFTLEEVVILDFSEEIGGGNPGSAPPKETSSIEESPAEKQVTQEESPVSTPTSNSNESSSEITPTAEPAPEQPKNDFSDLFGKGSGDSENGNGEGEGTGIGTGKGPNTGGGMGYAERGLINNPKPENKKNWVGLVAVQFVVDKDGNIISTTVLPTSKLTTINKLTKDDRNFIENDCKKKFKFSKGSGKDKFVLTMEYTIE